jgi:hypothetical protein
METLTLQLGVIALTIGGLYLLLEVSGGFEALETLLTKWANKTL